MAINGIATAWCRCTKSPARESRRPEWPSTGFRRDGHFHPACGLGTVWHLGIEASPRRSTLSYANGRRPAALFEEMLWTMPGAMTGLPF